jgi:hypothetical protein
MKRVVANKILHKQSQTAWGIGVGLTAPRCKRLASYEASRRASDLDDSLNWIYLVQDRVRWPAFVGMVIDVWFP